MRVLRPFSLLIVTAIAALAMTATTTSAQTLEVRNAATTQHCPAVIKFGHLIGGGCVVHVVSEGHVELAGHFLGIEVHRTDCNNEFTARLDEDGNGYFTNQQFTGAECVRKPCEEANGTVEPWRIEASELVTGGERLEVLLCAQTVGGGSIDRCHMSIPFTEIGTSRQYEFTANDLNGEAGSIRCELTGHWLTDWSPNVLDITHLD